MLCKGAMAAGLRNTAPVFGLNSFLVPCLKGSNKNAQAAKCPKLSTQALGPFLGTSNLFEDFDNHKSNPAEPEETMVYN